jgi:membrane-anchored mycosin MYCP
VPAMRRRLEKARLGGLLGAAVAIVVGISHPASAVEPTDDSYVKYYLVESSYQGQPETLAEIAERFLDSPSRATEIFGLNSGRVQPDGGRLTDPAKLNAGWALVLPWDAFGDGVRYGLLPAATPSPTPRPSTAPTGVGVTNGPTAKPEPTPASGCASTGKPAEGSKAQWGALRVAPDHAWPYSRGASVLVAIADSGVDASLPPFSGRITVGADIVSGTGRGNTDCLGSGTAMASIISARGDSGGSVTGVAPDATILPVRLVTGNPVARPSDQAAAIEFAVAAGARVIALGGYVAPDDPSVAAAIKSATEHDVVVVMGVPVGTTATGSGAAAANAGVLRVGAIDIDGKPAAQYAPGSIDVVAPGVGVAALGISGTGQLQVTGSQYAASFVAGEVALVRARFPELTAAEVVHRVKATADPIGGSAAGDGFGAGLINPGRSVTQVIPEESQSPEPQPAVAQPRQSHPFQLQALVIVSLLAVATVILLILRMRRIIRPARPADAGAAGEAATGGAGAPSSTRDGSGPRAGRPAEADPPATPLPRRTATLTREYPRYGAHSVPGGEPTTASAGTPRTAGGPSLPSGHVRPAKAGSAHDSLWGEAAGDEEP